MTGINERSIREWTNNGNIKKIGRGQILLKQAFEFALRRDVIQGGSQHDLPTDEEARANKAMLEKVKADFVETEVDIEKRNLIKRRELGGYLINEMTVFKRELLALSRTIPSECYGMDRDEIVDTLQRRLQKVYDERLDASELDTFLECTENDI